MIDTIRLVLDEGQFVLLEPARFQPHAQKILEISKTPSRAMAKAVLNPSKEDKQEGYSPRLTLRRRPPNLVELVIEFSIPKLLYGNNFDEVTEADFSEVIKALQDRLSAWGVYIFADMLRNASVGAIHYGKNIILPRYTLARSIINLLSKVPVNQWFDHTQVEFRNGGHLYKIHSNSFELAFYDKVKDLQKAQRGEKRAYESDNDGQGDLFEFFEVARGLQVLRIEARLNSRAKILHMLKSLGLPDDDLRFFALFKQEIAQKGLLHYWKPYQQNLPLIAMAESETANALMDVLAKHDPEASSGTLLQRLGAMALVREIGWNGLRSYCDDRPKAYQRLKKELDSLPEAATPALQDIEAIGASLQAFEPVKMGDYLIETPPKVSARGRKKAV